MLQRRLRGLVIADWNQHDLQIDASLERLMADIAKADIENDPENGAASLDHELSASQHSIGHHLRARRPNREQGRGCDNERNKPTMGSAELHHPPPTLRCTAK